MNNLFIIDGTSGIWKSDLMEYIGNYLVGSTIIKKFTTRELAENEDPAKLDLEFLSEAEFARINPDFQYLYNNKKYGFTKRELTESLNKYNNVFIIIRNYDTINLVKKQFSRFNVVTVFIYTEVSEVTKRLNLTSRKGLKESVKQAFNDYLRYPEIYDKVIINGSSANDFYRLINMLIDCCPDITKHRYLLSKKNKFHMFIPRRAKIIIGIILGILLPLLIGIIVNMVTQGEWNHWKYISLMSTAIFVIIVGILEYVIVFESNIIDKE